MSPTEFDRKWEFNQLGIEFSQWLFSEKDLLVQDTEKYEELYYDEFKEYMTQGEEA